jgi:membrane protease YdiL (CAAX protease family)
LRFALAADLPFGVVMTLFYVWRRDLAASAIAHGSGLVIVLSSMPSSRL